MLCGAGGIYNGFANILFIIRVLSPLWSSCSPNRLVTQEREAKRAYKEAFEALTKAKAKTEASARQEEGLRRELLASFELYCEAKVTNRTLVCEQKFTASRDVHTCDAGAKHA